MSIVKKVIQDFSQSRSQRNPHKVTAAQVDGYTKSEIDALIEGGLSGVPANFSGYGFMGWEPPYASISATGYTIVPNDRTLALVEEDQYGVAVLENITNGLNSGVSWITLVPNSSGSYNQYRTCTRYRPPAIEALIPNSRVYRIHNSQGNGAIWGTLLLNTQGETALFIALTKGTSQPCRHRGAIIKNLPAIFDKTAHCVLSGKFIYLIKFDNINTAYVAKVDVDDVENKNDVEMTLVTGWTVKGVLGKTFSGDHIQYTDDRMTTDNQGNASFVVSSELGTLTTYDNLCALIPDPTGNKIRVLYALTGSQKNAINVPTAVQVTHVFDIDLVEKTVSLLGDSATPNYITSTTGKDINLGEVQLALAKQYGAVSGDVQGGRIMLSNGRLCTVTIPRGGYESYSFVGEVATDIHPYEQLHPDVFKTGHTTQGKALASEGYQARHMRYLFSNMGYAIAKGDTTPYNNFTNGMNLIRDTLTWNPLPDVGTITGFEPTARKSLTTVKPAMAVCTGEKKQVTSLQSTVVRTIWDSPREYVFAPHVTVGTAYTLNDAKKGTIKGVSSSLYRPVINAAKTMLTNDGVSLSTALTEDIEVWIPPTGTIGTYQPMARVFLYDRNVGLSYHVFIPVTLTIDEDENHDLLISAMTPGDTHYSLTVECTGTHNSEIYVGYLYEHVVEGKLHYTNYLIPSLVGVTNDKGKGWVTIEWTVRADGSAFPPKIHVHYDNFLNQLRYILVEGWGPCLLDTESLGDTGGMALLFYLRTLDDVDQFYHEGHDSTRYLLCTGIDVDSQFGTDFFTSIQRPTSVLLDGKLNDLPSNNQIINNKAKLTRANIIVYSSYDRYYLGIKESFTSSSLDTINYVDIGYIDCNDKYPIAVNLANTLVLN